MTSVIKKSALLVSFVWFLFVFSCPALAQETVAKRVDTDVVQGVLAVQSMDGWLLAGNKDKNPIAKELVRPDGTPRKSWFYFIPSFGQPSILHHKNDAASFRKIAGKKIEYRGHRDLQTGLQSLLAGTQIVAMEYAPRSGIDSLTRVDAGIIALVKKTGVTIQSSANLVQFTKSLWGPDGRVAHYVAVHHLSKLRAEALAFIAGRIWDNRPVTEWDVQMFLANGFRVRGLKGSSSVSAGANTAKPNYQAAKRRSALIQKEDIVLMKLHAALSESNRPIFASLSWVAYVGETVPGRFQKRFGIVSKARDRTVAFIGKRVKARRLVRGFEADQQAREEIGKAGMASRFVHRTGHSLDTSLEGAGANLDDYESHDTRNLVIGSGFTVGPGIYAPGDFGVQSIVDLHVSRNGVEVTTPQQKRITPILLEYPKK